MVAAGARAPNRCQTISNSHGDWPNTVVPQIMSCSTLTMLQTLYKLWSSETWRSGTRYFLCKWWVHLLTPITLSATLLRHRANARLCWQRQQPHSTGQVLYCSNYELPWTFSHMPLTVYSGESQFMPFETTFVVIGYTGYCRHDCFSAAS